MTKLKPPIFIVGCSHSGTTLMLAILGAHSQIHAIRYETKVAIMKTRINKKSLTEFDKKTIDANKKRWVEKTAEHIFYIDTIFRSCPDAKVLLMIRDGRDVAASIGARTGSIKEGIEYWIKSNTTAIKYWNHLNVLLIKYENLIIDFQSTMQNALDFLGEEYEDGIKNFYEYYPQDIERPLIEDDKHHHRLRAWQLSQPLFDGRDRYKELEPIEIRYITRLGRKMLIKLGYIAKG